MIPKPKREEWVSTRTLPEKLAIRAGSKVLLVGIDDDWFRDLLRQCEAEVEHAETAVDFDLIFFRVESTTNLGRLLELRQLLKADGAIWVLRRKGSGRVVEQSDTMEAGKAAGLVDVKVVSFSPDESAEKYVIPLAQR